MMLIFRQNDNFRDYLKWNIVKIQTPGFLLSEETSNIILHDTPILCDEGKYHPKVCIKLKINH